MKCRMPKAKPGDKGRTQAYRRLLKGRLQWIGSMEQGIEVAILLLIYWGCWIEKTGEHSKWLEWYDTILYVLVFALPINGQCKLPVRNIPVSSCQNTI